MPEAYAFTENSVDNIRNAIAKSQNYTPSLGGGSTSKTQVIELVLVAIVGVENGGGMYKGSILYGGSNGGTGGSSYNQTTTEIVHFIEGKKDGASSAEILERFGKVKPSVSAFLKGKTDRKIKFKGPRNKRIYFVA
jgi:hypothetical protein